MFRACSAAHFGQIQAFLRVSGLASFFGRQGPEVRILSPRPIIQSLTGDLREGWTAFEGSS